MRRLVVGIDGTDASRRAVEWAARTVGADGSLHCVTALSPMIELGIDAVAGDSADYQRVLQRDLSGRWTEGLAGRVGQLTTEVREQSASDALAASASEFDADAIVVGAHLHKLLDPFKIGHTTRKLLRRLPTTLVIVPDSVQGDLTDGPIVVGIGHGEATEAAVWWASELADRRGVAVGLVRATGDAPLFQADGILDLVGYFLHPESREQWATKDVDRLAAAVQENSRRDLPIAIEVRPGLPAVQLVEASEHAALLVIGQHWSAISLGRHISQPLRYALTHARCPIAVVPEAAVHVG
jgi:nucleotide-binding universal stress UspA family protein